MPELTIFQLIVVVFVVCVLSILLLLWWLGRGHRDRDAALTEYLRKALGPDGLEFFRKLKEATGEVSPVLTIQRLSEIFEIKDPIDPSVARIPHAVHFREGMRVRNLLRESGLVDHWSCHQLDDNWADLVEKAIA